jgi:hypothetical protein
MRKHGSSKLLALGSIVAVASGCSGGGNAATLAKTAPSATKRIASTAHATITPSALVHAMQARRRPSFIDVNPPEGDTLTLTVRTFSDVSGPDGVTTDTPFTISANQTTPINVTFPIYGPTGTIQVVETDVNFGGDAIADTGTLGYNIPLGTDVTLGPDNVSGTTNGVLVQGLTLQPVVGGIAFSTSPTGAGATILSSSNASPTCLANLSGSGGTLFFFPVDLLGNFTTATGPGAFVLPVTLSGNSGSEIVLNSTAVPGAFTYSGLGLDIDIRFDANDIFGNSAHGALSMSTGYLCSTTPTPPP